FAPQAGGTVHGNLVIPAGGSPALLQIKRHHNKAAIDSIGPGPGPLGTAATAALQGTGVAQGAITLPQSPDLGTYSVGSPPNHQDVTITNSGNAPVNFSTVAVSGPFQITNGCTTTLAQGATCVITVLYSSPTIGAATGSLVVSTDAANGSAAIALSAT